MRHSTYDYFNPKPCQRQYVLLFRIIILPYRHLLQFTFQTLSTQLTLQAPFHQFTLQVSSSPPA